MPKTWKECIRTVEKQVELAIVGLQTEIGITETYLEDDLSLEEKREILAELRSEVEAIEDLFEQLDDMKDQARVIAEGNDEG